MPHPETSCFGKISYPSGTAAGRAKRHLAKRQTAPSDVYRCQHCDGWHLGRKPDINQAARRRDGQRMVARHPEFFSPK